MVSGRTHTHTHTNTHTHTHTHTHIHAYIHLHTYTLVPIETGDNLPATSILMVLIDLNFSIYSGDIKKNELFHRCHEKKLERHFCLLELANFKYKYVNGKGIYYIPFDGIGNVFPSCDHFRNICSRRNGHDLKLYLWNGSRSGVNMPIESVYSTSYLKAMGLVTFSRSVTIHEIIIK